MKMKNIILWLIIICTPLTIHLVKNYYCIDISTFRIYEDATKYTKKPEINDLYVTSNESSLTYFKIAGKNGKSNSFIILEGNDTLKNLDDTFIQKELIEQNEGFSNTVSFQSIGKLQSMVEANGEKTKVFRMYGKPPFNWWDYYQTPISYFTFFLFTCFLLLILNRISKFFLGNKYSTSNIEIILYLGAIITIIHFYKFADYPFLALFLLSTIPLSILFHRLNNRYFRFQHPVTAEFNKFALLYSGGVILQLLAAGIISLFYTKPYTNFYTHALSKFHYADQLGFLPMLSTFLIGWVLFAIGNFLNNARKHIILLRQQEKELVISKQKELQSQAELDALQARVNPHFLYNSLNSIAGLAQEDPAKTEEMAIALSHFFKYSTNRQTENWSTVEKEIEILDTYLEIEKIRFGERLQFKLTCSDELYDLKIPRFLLQPLVENAIKYGYNKTTNSINIELVISQQNQQLQFQLFDSGNPFPENMGSGYGVQSVRKKLALLYPEKHELAFINEPKKQVAITLFL